MKKSRYFFAAIGLSMALVMPAVCRFGIVQAPAGIEAYVAKARAERIEEQSAYVGDRFSVATKGKVFYSTSNEKVATVTKKGKVKILAEGKVRITAKTAKQTIIYKLTVRKASEKIKIAYHFADKEEGRKCRLSNEKYFNGLTQEDLNFRTQKKDAALAEFKKFSAAQILEFTKEEKAFLDARVKELEEKINQRGYQLPVKDDIIFIKTTMADEGGAGAYTHQNQIYLGKSLFTYYKENSFEFDIILAHELFHCLTRQNPEFKAKIYDVIGAEVMEEEVQFPQEVKEKILSNPDVESFDSYATFTIHGKKEKCVVVPYFVKGFEKEGDSFFDAVDTKLIPVDDTSRIYSVDEASDFWEVFGENTGYILAIEETMADNFSYAVMLDEEQIKEAGFPSPEILKEIQKRISK